MDFWNVNCTIHRLVKYQLQILCGFLDFTVQNFFFKTTRQQTSCHQHGRYHLVLDLIEVCLGFLESWLPDLKPPKNSQFNSLRSSRYHSWSPFTIIWVGSRNETETMHTKRDERKFNTPKNYAHPSLYYIHLTQLGN